MATKAAGEKFSLKDQLFNRERVQYLADRFHSSDANFEKKRFVSQTMKGFSALELKQRIAHIADQLNDFLSSNYKQATKQIVAALPPPLDPAKTDDDFGDFIFAPLGEFVARNGLKKGDVAVSLKTLKTITQRFSMEDAIREFIITHPEATLAELTKWADDPNYHVRRLVSEGTRPFLPWSKRVNLPAGTTIPFLDSLHADPTRYVTRSVANHLNDISKIDAALVLETLTRWQQTGKQAPSELAWMNRHALRTLVKKGDAKALKFLGFRSDPRIKVANFQLKNEQIQPGQAVEFSFDITAEREESLLIDFVIDFVKANGTRAPKVHKLKQIELASGQSQTLKKRHVLRANATTYKLYPGPHRLSLQVNGNILETLSFELQ